MLKLKTFITSLVLVSLSPAHAANLDHQQCTACHLDTAPQATSADLLIPLPGLCISCHSTKSGKGEHVVNVIPSTLPPAELPLQYGRLGCITCHDPHGDTPGQLRIAKEQLCQACHQL